MRRLSPTTTTVIWFMCPTHCSPTPPFCVLAAFNAIFDMLAPWLQCTRTLGKKSARNSIGDLISIANHEHTCALSSATLTLESAKTLWTRMSGRLLGCMKDVYLVFFCRWCIRRMGVLCIPYSILYNCIRNMIDSKIKYALKNRVFL